MKELVKYLYSGAFPENLDKIAFELLPIACKYELEELKRVCDFALRRILSRKNAIEILLLADRLDCWDLFHFCKPLAKDRVKDLVPAAPSQLHARPVMLLHLFKDI